MPTDEDRATTGNQVSESLEAPFETVSFETVVKLLDYPMFIVTTAADGSQGGCLVGFATQSSISPPRYLVGLSEKNHTYRLATRATHLVVHVLGTGQRALAQLFGEQTGDKTDKLAQCSWRPGPGGAPILDGVAGWFSGRILERLPLGDHVGFLLEPGAGQVLQPDSDLLTLNGVGDLEAAHDA
jgi:flavin reductase (DIM6/NTAB) family NADH-FMN oxidoreductase RutF